MMGKIRNEISLMASKIRSVYFNFRYLPFEIARHLPFFVHWSVKINIVNSQINFDSLPSKFIFQYGIDKSPDVPTNQESLFVLQNSVLNLSGRYPVKIRRGGAIACENARLAIGGYFFANSNLYLKCQKEIEIGNDVMLGYNVSIRDSDGHVINNVKNPSAKIIIGDCVWINAKCDVLKGVRLKSGTIVGYRSLVTAKLNNEHNEKDLVVGVPAKKIKSGVIWSGLSDFFGKDYSPVQEIRDKKNE